MRLASNLLVLSLSSCVTSSYTPPQERLDEPDVEIPLDCGPGTTEIDVTGTVSDWTTGAPIADAKVDITEAWATPNSFPTNGCLIGSTTTGTDGTFSLRVSASSNGPILAFLITGAGRAPTIHDKSVSCLFGCNVAPQDIVAPSRELVDRWREELFIGGMNYALNRGLVVYRYHDASGTPADGVLPIYRRDAFDDEGRAFRPGSEVRFIDGDRETLGDYREQRTLGAGAALIGGAANTSGYFRVSGERGSDRWSSVGVIAATGWIYFDSSSLP